jgi:hypothetical protein
MTFLKQILAMVVAIAFISENYGQEPHSSKSVSNGLGIHKYEVGLGLYSHFHDYNIGGFYETKIAVYSEINKYVSSSLVLGLRFDQLLLSDNPKNVVAGGIYTQMFLIPVVRYYILKGLFLDAGIGGGYGFSLTRQSEQGHFQDWRNIFLYHHHIASGFDFLPRGFERIILRPSIYYRFRSSYVPKNNTKYSKSKRNEFGITINFLIIFYKPKNIPQ